MHVLFKHIKVGGNVVTDRLGAGGSANGGASGGASGGAGGGTTQSRSYDSVKRFQVMNVVVPQRLCIDWCHGNECRRAQGRWG